MRFPGTWGLAALTLLVFAIQWTSGGEAHATDLRTQLRMGALRPDRVAEHAEYYRLILPMFLHHGWVHLALNGVALLQLAGLVESLWGTTRLVAFYGLCGLAGTLMSATLGPPWAGAVGASGAIMGLAGVLVGTTWFGAEPVRAWLREVLGRRLLYSVLLTFGLGIALWFVLPVIDNWAHFGGFACGVALALANPDATRRSGPAPAIATVWVLATAFCFAWMARDGAEVTETLDIDTARLLSAAASEQPDALRTPVALAQMLDSYAEAGAEDEGLGALRRTTSRMSDPQLLAFLVVELLDDSRFDAPAQVVLERWLEIQPDDPSALNTLAWHLVTRSDREHRDPDRAEALSRRSLERIEDAESKTGRRMRASFLDTLGEVLYQQGTLDEAAAVQRESLELATELEMDDVAEITARLHKIEAG